MRTLQESLENTVALKDAILQQANLKGAGITVGGMWPDTSLNVQSDLKIYVPDNLVDSYKAASGWSVIAEKIHPLTDLANG